MLWAVCVVDTLWRRGLLVHDLAEFVQNLRFALRLGDFARKVPLVVEMVAANPGQLGLFFMPSVQLIYLTSVLIVL